MVIGLLTLTQSFSGFFVLNRRLLLGCDHNGSELIFISEWGFAWVQLQVVILCLQAGQTKKVFEQFDDDSFK